MSAQREQHLEVEHFARASHLAVLVAGGPPAVPVKRSSGPAKLQDRSGCAGVVSECFHE